MTGYTKGMMAERKNLCIGATTTTCSIRRWKRTKRKEIESKGGGMPSSAWETSFVKAIQFDFAKFVNLLCGSDEKKTKCRSRKTAGAFPEGLGHPQNNCAIAQRCRRQVT